MSVISAHAYDIFCSPTHTDTHRHKHTRVDTYMDGWMDGPPRSLLHDQLQDLRKAMVLGADVTNMRWSCPKRIKKR